MLTLIALLYLWEESVARARKKLGSTFLLPVLNSMLTEMGGLGFIGLMLNVA